MSDFVVEAGKCDPAYCNSDSYTFIECENGPGGECRVGSCFSDRYTVPNHVPIKQLLKGTSASPWVKLWFETRCCAEGEEPCIQPNVPEGCVNCNDSDHCVPTEETLITTGNISQPGVEECLNTSTRTTSCCQAAIKGFQYSWGGINAGNTCKITIHDEAGGSFDAWFKRLARNPLGESVNTGTGVYKMRVQWGWIVQGNDDGACPSVVTGGFGTCNQDNPVQNTTLLCSPCLWFLPTNITCQFQNGRFVYELEGVDLLQQSSRTPASMVFGGTTTTGDNTLAKTYFKDAVEWLARRSRPPFRVNMYQLSETPDDPLADIPQPMEFQVNMNQTKLEVVRYINPVTNEPCPEGIGGQPEPCGPPAVVTDANAAAALLKERGPLGVWDTKGLNPLAAIQSWLGKVRAYTIHEGREGKGITMNYDATSQSDEVCVSVSEAEGEEETNEVEEGQLILWANAHPHCSQDEQTYNHRLKALYVVNGGKCSPVLSFTPNIKWNFTASMSAGGGMGTTSGEMTQARDNLRFNKCAILGEGPRYSGSPDNSQREASFGNNAEREHIISMAEHLRANYLHNSIEAELRVQGDPSDWLCSPVFGYGRNVAILFINPFFLVPGDYGCAKWSNQIPDLDLDDTSCNQILSNRNWYIKGVDHQIRDGSYVTTIKVMLFVPRSESPSDLENVSYMGGDPLSSLAIACNQGTGTCLPNIVMGGKDVTLGDLTFCDPICPGPDDLYVS